MKSIQFLFVAFFPILISHSVYCQDPTRFRNEVKKIVAGDTAVKKKNLILFTGSSSVRMWKTLKEDFPKYNVVNRGFGGSAFPDLIYFVDTLVIQYQPIQVFIYEGDNDIGGGQEPDDILSNAIKLTRAIKDKLPRTEVVFISPKPSILRWNLKDKYVRYNEKLKSWSVTQKGVQFVDVWTPMLDNTGEVRKDLFIEDGLHMNATGYSIWTTTIAPYLKK